MQNDARLFIGSRVDDYGLNPYEFRILCRIARRGRCTESLSRMAPACGMSRTKCAEAVDVLEAAGFVKVDRANGRAPVMEYQAPLFWKLPEDLEDIRKRVKTCSRGVQVQEVQSPTTCTPDEQVSPDLPTRRAGTCPPGTQHKETQEGESKSTADYNGERSGTGGPLDGVDDKQKERARHFYEVWRRAFPTASISENESLHFITLAHDYDLLSRMHREAYDYALGVWLYGVNSKNWNPSNIVAIGDRMKKYLEEEQPRGRRAVRPQAPVMEKNHVHDPAGAASRSREQEAIQAYEALPAGARSEIEERARAKAERLINGLPNSGKIDQRKLLEGTVRLEIISIIQNEGFIDGKNNPQTD